MILSQYNTLTRKEVRELDRRAIEEIGVPSIVLMENAGRSAAEYLLTQSISGSVIILCGKGNNGGDGFVIARHLDNHHISTRILLCADRNEITGDADIQLKILEKSHLPIFQHSRIDWLTECTQAAWIVDALFGTGLEGSVRPPFDKIIEQINSSGTPILAIDIPSGLDCDSGIPLGVAIKATQTVTFAALKKGLTAPSAQNYTGKITVLDIGIPRLLNSL